MATTPARRPIHRLRPFPHARPRCWHMPQRGVPRPVSCYYKLAPGQQRVPALRLMMATTPARRPIHRLRPFPHARPRCWHMPQRGVPRPVSCYYKLAPGQQRVPALRLMMATTPARLMTWRPGSSRASPASSSTRLGGSGRCSSRGGSGRRRLRRGRWRSRRRWFPWRLRSRVGVAEPEVMWREVRVCVCVWT